MDFDPHHFFNNYRRRITIIVPVFNALEELKACINSVLAHTIHPRWRLLIIDDCSPDQEVRSFLRTLENHEHIEIIYNEENLGYTKTINKGIKESHNDNIVLLNSDAEVTPNWLVALLVSAFKHTTVGTVTPMSNNAGAFSFPHANIETKVPSNQSRADFARLISRNASKFPDIQVPTGNGFCMFIKRDLIEAIGYFDEVSFPRGYGEENEFCMRALKNGYINLLTPSAYVYHIKTASFKGERTQLIKDGEDTIKRLFPSYFKRVKKAFSSVQMLSLREHIANVIASMDVQ
jgi:GT2 family glycosyltransferase